MSKIFKYYASFDISSLKKYILSKKTKTGNILKYKNVISNNNFSFIYCRNIFLLILLDADNKKRLFKIL